MTADANKTLNSVALDTHLYVKRLIETGMSEATAEAVTGFVRDAQDGNLFLMATRADVDNAKAEIHKKIGRSMFWAIVINATVVIGAAAWLAKHLGH